MFFRIAIWFSGCYKTRLTMALSLILPVFVVNFAFIYIQTRRDLSRDLEEVRGALAAQVSSQVSDFRDKTDLFVNSAQTLASRLSEQTDAYAMIAEILTLNDDVTFAAVAYTSDFLQRIDQGKVADYRLMEGAGQRIDTQTADGYCVKYFRDENKKIRHERINEYQFETWYHSATLFQKGMWTGPDLSANPIVSYYSIPFFYQNVPAGVVVLGVDISVVFRKFHRYFKQDDSLHTFVLNGNGHILYSNNPQAVGCSLYSLIHGHGTTQLFEHLDRVMSGTNGSFLYTNSGLLPSVDRDDQTWFIYLPIHQGTDWTLVKIFSVNMVTQKVHARIVYAWIWYTLEFVFVVFLILVLMLNIYNPIIAVSSMSQMVADGARDISVPEKYEKLNNPMGRLASNFNYMLRELNHYIALEVEEAAKICSVNRELELAKNIQRSLMPDCLEINDDRVAMSAYYAPAHYVAGDFYDFWKIDDDQFFFLIADVSGSGVPAAMVMSSTQTLIRMATEWEKEPGSILTLVNNAMLAKNRSYKFITIFLGLYNLKTGRLKYCSAGHPYPLILSEEGQVCVLSDNRSSMVGVFKDAEYYTSTMVLHPGETLLLYTDGVTESIAGRVTCEPFGEGRLSECCRSLTNCEPDEVVKGIVEEVMTYAREGQSDDISLLAIKRKSGDEPLRL